MAKKTQLTEIHNCASGIVLYNPEINRLQCNIDSIIEQVTMVYCFDNGSNNSEQINKLLDKYENVILISSDVNLGIATALNYISERAIKEGIKWLLTLDQDSICPKEMVKKFLNYTNNDEVAIVCPVMYDIRRPMEKIPTDVYSDVEFCITSGSFVNLNIWKKVGGYDDYLFIGLVDDEYCYRLRINNYRILQVNTILLDHELGNIKESRFSELYLKIGGLLSSKKIKALSYKREVSPMRVYYAERNIIYLSKKYQNYPIGKFSKKRAVYNGISNVLRGWKKIKIIKAFIKGIRDAEKVSVEPYVLK